MAFTVEDGTGLEAANAYIAEQFFRDHHTDRGRDVSGLVQVVVETGIVRATDYLDKRFGRKFRGVRSTKRQGLEWPRLDAFDNDDFLLSEVDEIPRQLQKACAEYALRAIIYGELAPDPLRPAPAQDLSDATDVDAQSTDVLTGQVRSQTKEIGPLRKTTVYTNQSDIEAQLRTRAAQSSLISTSSIPEYPEADLWIEELLSPPERRRLVRGS